MFFACCTRGVVGDALALMSRHDPGTGRRLLGKDVLVRGCGQMPGGVDGEQGLVLLEGRATRAGLMVSGFRFQGLGYRVIGFRV